MKDTLFTCLMNLLFIGFVFICCLSGGVSTTSAMSYLIVFYIGAIWGNIKLDSAMERVIRDRGMGFGLLCCIILGGIAPN